MEEQAFSPDHYTSNDGFEVVDFIERVLCNLDVDEVAISPSDLWLIGNALKYALRAGKKDDWQVEADKCANYLFRAFTGKWIK